MWRVRLYVDHDVEYTIISEPFTTDSVIIDVEGPREMNVSWLLSPEAYPTGDPIIYKITCVPLDGSGGTHSTAYALGEYNNYMQWIC